MALIKGSVSVESVKKCAGSPCGIPAHEQFVIFSGQSAEYRFHDWIRNARGFIHDKEHVVLVESLHVFRLGGGPGYCEPTLFIAYHINIGLCPFKD